MSFSQILRGSPWPYYTKLTVPQIKFSLPSLSTNLNISRNFSSKLTWDTVLSEDNRKKCLKRMKDINSIRLFQEQKVKKHGAVLVPLCHINGELSFLYTVRSKGLKSHKGEISFPGGMYEEGDEDLIKTALRETDEEVGIDPNKVDVWGALPPVPAISNSSITAIFGYVSDVNLDNLVVSDDEVESVFTVPLKMLCEKDVACHTQFRSKSFKNGYTMPVFITSDHRIWGLTAIFTHMALTSLLPGLYKKKLRHIRPLEK